MNSVVRKNKKVAKEMFVRPEGMKEKVFVYLRKSTEDRKDGRVSKQVNSLKYQKTQSEKIAKEKNLDIVKYFQDSKTGMKAYVRDDFNKMVKEIEDTPDVTGIIVSEISRLGRNFGDGGRILWLMQDGSIQNIYTNDKHYTNLPTDQLMMAVIFAISKYESDENSYRSKQATRTKVLSNSIPSYAAPWGYKNAGIKGKRRWVVDEKEAEKVRRVFKLYATGMYNLPKLRDALTAEGILNTMTRKAYSLNMIHQTLQRVSYTGFFVFEGKTIEGKYEPIVSLSLFNSVQEILKGKEHVKSKHMDHTYTGLIRCSHCDSVLTASVAKKVITYYRCSRPTKNIELHKGMAYLEENLLNKCIGKMIEELEIDGKIWEELKSYISTQTDEDVLEMEKIIGSVNYSIKVTEAERDDYIIGATRGNLEGSESFKKKLVEYDEMLSKARQRVSVLETKKSALIDSVNWRATTLVNVGRRFRFADSFAQRELIKQFCANLEYDGKKLTIYWAPGIRVLTNGKEKSQWLLDKDSNLGPSA